MFTQESAPVLVQVFRYDVHYTDKEDESKVETVSALNEGHATTTIMNKIGRSISVTKVLRRSLDCEMVVDPRRLQ